MDVALVSLKAAIHGSVPSKIYEAMASGTPVLLAANGEAKEIVQRSGAGVAVPPGNVEELVRSIRKMASHTEWRRKMGEAGRRTAEKFYDRLEIAQEFETVLLGREGWG
jgi:glycosyltransferase involved in cell wall biosynthesis